MKTFHPTDEWFEATHNFCQEGDDNDCEGMVWENGIEYGLRYSRKLKQWYIFGNEGGGLKIKPRDENDIHTLERIIF